MSNWWTNMLNQSQQNIQQTNQAMGIPSQQLPIVQQQAMGINPNGGTTGGGFLTCSIINNNYGTSINKIRLKGKKVEEFKKWLDAQGTHLGKLLPKPSLFSFDEDGTMVINNND